MKNFKKHLCHGDYLFVSFLAVFTIVLRIFPALEEWFEYDRQAIFSGDYWRLFTGHFCHWNQEHFMWDFFAFALLVYLLKQWSSRSLNLILIMVPLAISIGLVILEPNMLYYRGLSGLCCALAVSLIVEMFCDKAIKIRYFAILITLIWLIKIAFESASGGSIVVESNDFRVILASHYLGMGCGMLLTFIVKSPLYNRFSNSSMESNHA